MIKKGIKSLKNKQNSLNPERLQRLALRYVERYATTRYKLTSYLQRKLREREWEDAEPPAIAELVERFAELGYIDDVLFAKNRASALVSRGYGPRRVAQNLYQAGIEEQDSQEAMAISDEQKWQAADKFARKRKIGPYATQLQSAENCQKQLQAFIRAGHDYEIGLRYVSAQPNQEINKDK